MSSYIQVPYDGEVDVGLEEFDEQDIVEYLENEGYYVSGEGHGTESRKLLEDLYQAYTRGERDKVMEMLPTLFWETIGKMA